MDSQVISLDALWAEKDKDSTKDYRFVLSNQIADDDRIVSSSWTVTPAGAVTIVSSQTSDNAVTVVLSGGAQRAWYAVTCSWVSASGVSDQFTLRLFIKEDAETSITALGSALFPNKFTAIAKMRRDRLAAAMENYLGSGSLTDEYIWEKLLAAEATVAHELRVPLGPTRFFSSEPTQDEIDALGGMPWVVDPPYDWSPEDFLGDKWGYMLLRHKPVISVIGMRVAFPSEKTTVLDVPAEWIRVDKKYGHVNLIPSSPLAITTFGASLMTMVSSGRRLPFAVHVNYTAGLTNVQRDYPDLIDVVMRVAALGMIDDSFQPQSGSISADGLSQSISIDASKYRESIDRILHGAEGGNGGLMAKIHGIRMMVM